MILAVDLPTATLERLRAETLARGTAIEAKLENRKMTFAEAAQPICEAIEASGMSEQAVEAFFESELRAMRMEKRQAKSLK
jgi:hypothetical protein